MGAAAASFFAAGLFAFNEKSRHGKMEVIQKQMKTNGFFYIFILRILPVNFDVISYAAPIESQADDVFFGDRSGYHSGDDRPECARRELYVRQCADRTRRDLSLHRIFIASRYI